MKIKTILPLLLILISLTACVETIRRPIHQNTIAPEYSVEKETLKSRISAILPAEEIQFTSSVTEKSGEEKYHTLRVEIVPDTFPANGLSFYRMTDEMQEAVESGIGNLDDYQKMIILVHQTVEENGVERNQSYKKEIDL